MVTLEQVKLLETKITQTIEYIERLSSENMSLRKKLDTNQKRVDELEQLVLRFKEEQGRIEDGILSALDRLSQFESAIEKSLGFRNQESKPAIAEKPAAVPEKQPVKPAASRPAEAAEEIAETAQDQTDSVIADIQDPLEFDEDLGEQADSESSNKTGELDIF